jgi:hypothetical protein
MASKPPNYPYQPDKAVAYALRFAAEPNISLFYYYQNGDCANFVSQCVWAGYGGYPSPYDFETLRRNALMMVRMVPRVWAGDSRGASANWSNVEAFYHYVTDTSKRHGPQGKGGNNRQPFYRLQADAIYPGDVLQFGHPGSGGVYTHSALVTQKISPATDYSHIKVSQHTYDIANRYLSELIASWSGRPASESPCYMRKIAFTETWFEK